jgi:hypothetical protein
MVLDIMYLFLMPLVAVHGFIPSLVKVMYFLFLKNFRYMLSIILSPKLKLCNLIGVESTDL